ncbi:MAG: PAS domain S-box protein [Sedimentisphaerales bacterium]
MENTRYKILLIEDDKLDQAAFERLVEEQELPYDYTIAGSVSEAQKILGCERFDILICDYSLGDGTAFDILDLVKNTPTVVVTGTGNEEIAVKAWRAGAYDYLIKDIERSYLIAVPITVENAIRHKKAEDKLRLLSGAIMSTNDSVYITDMNDKIIFVNKAFCETYGYKQEDVLGKDSSLLWLGKPKTANTRTVIRTQGIGGTWEVGFYHKRKDGRIFPVSLSRAIIKDSHGNRIAVVGTARDITERILIEDELRRANLKLKQQNQLKSELAVVVAETAKRLLADENIRDVQMQNKDTCQSIDRARKVISDFLDISKIDAAALELKRTEFSLHSIICEVVQALSPLAEEKNIELKSFMPDSELIINVDRDRIVQALTNLISNSINSIPAKGQVEVRLNDIGSEIIIEVQDDGPTIESSQINKIFDCLEWIKEHPYWRPEQDLFLGLSIAKKIIEMHGGCIWVEGADTSQGNIFCLSLPKPGIREKISMAAKTAKIC